MLRSRARISIGLSWAVAAALAPGCSSDQIPPPPGLRPGMTNSAAEPAKTIFLVLPGKDDPELESWVLYAHREANKERAIFRTLGRGPGESSTAEPDLVRRAVADGASAVLVVPGEAPGLVEALAEAEAKGVPVVLIGRPVPPPPGSPPFTLVAPVPFGPSAEKAVAAAMEDAKVAGRPADGSAMLVIDRAGDRYSPERIAALKAAAEKAGLKVRTYEFEGSTTNEASAALVKAIREDSNTVILLPEGEMGMTLASKARMEAGQPQVFVGGYVSYKSGLVPAAFANESCTVEYRGEELGRLAVQAAMDRLKGQERGHRVDLDLRFHRRLAGAQDGADRSPLAKPAPGLPQLERPLGGIEAETAKPQ